MPPMQNTNACNTEYLLNGDVKYCPYVAKLFVATDSTTLNRTTSTTTVFTIVHSCIRVVNSWQVIGGYNEALTHSVTLSHSLLSLLNYAASSDPMP